MIRQIYKLLKQIKNNFEFIETPPIYKFDEATFYMHAFS